MVSLLIMTHGKFGQELMAAAGSLLGDQDQAVALALLPGQGKEDLEKAALQSLETMDQGEGTLVLVDLLGGTPFNVGVSLMHGKKMDVLAGLSLPMLVDALTLRASGSYEELAKQLKEKAGGYAALASDLLQGGEG